MKRFSLLLLLFLFSTKVEAGTYADSLFLEANQLYSNQYYGEAVSLYDQLINRGYSHTNLYYNLGNAYYQLGELGNAIWAYEKGLELRPQDDDLQFNLKVANARIVDRVRIPEPFFLIKWYGALKRIFSPSQWLFSISLLLLASATFSAVGRGWKNRFSRMFQLVSSGGLTVVITFSLLFADIYFDLSDRESGVVVVREGRVYAAPSQSSNLLFMIHEGTKADVSSRQYPWVEIELIDGNKGWLSADQLRLL
ncbi:MAG: hypothetical protein CMG71_08010 [Candidatus Marinimicrobia bacterium]|nr:hypothetical protein [Candidatus Neomarinimicrobiota bacterium]|tara:strand:- start:12879 stop:13634 length:756 start_codon:yes stop_codon:yes gene_type:complete